MKKYLIRQCLCLNCRWFWEVLSISFDNNKEQCPDCKSFYVKTALRRPILKSQHSL